MTINPSTPLPPASEPDDGTRVRILDAAEEIFAEQGYEGATVRAICERAGVKNIGAVNYYFQGKERLYADTVTHALRTCTEGAPFPEWQPNATPEQKLRDFIGVMVARMVAAPKPSSLQLMMREFTQPSSACAEAVRRNIEPIAHRLGAILEELLPELPEQRRWLIGFSIMGQCLYYRQNRTVAELLIGAEAFAQLDATMLAQHIADFTLAGVGRGEPIAAPLPKSRGHQ